MVSVCSRIQHEPLMMMFVPPVPLPFPQRLQEVQVPVVSNSRCNAAYGSITSNMVCAGADAGGRDSCQVSLLRHAMTPVDHRLVTTTPSVNILLILTEQMIVS